MAKGSNKRPSNEQAEDDRAAKRNKMLEPLNAASRAMYKDIKVADLDNYICTDDYPGSGICSKKELMFCEANCHSRFLPLYSRQQARLSAAQSKYHEQMSTWIHANIDLYNAINLVNVGKAAERLLFMMDKKEYQWSSEMKDAIMYRVAFLISFEAYSKGSVSQSSAVFTRLAEVLEDNVTGAQLIEDLTAASERHLSKTEHRSSLWPRKTVKPRTTATTTTTTTQAPVALQESTTTRGSAISAAPHTIEYLEQQAAGYIQKSEDLQGTVEWADIDSIEKRHKHSIQGQHLARTKFKQLAGSIGAPEGILLHGVQGAGKNELVRSWCVHVNGILISFDKSMQGPLMGQTEKMLRVLFDKAIHLSATRPVVMFFDEADQFMSASVEEEHLLHLQATLKAYFNMIMDSDNEIYLIAATNWPEKIEWGNWGRRFSQRWHVKPAELDGRIKIIRRALAGIKEELAEDGLHEVALALDKYTPYDIKKVVKRFATSRLSLLFDCTQWREMEWKEEKRLVPASDEDDVVLVAAFDELSDDEQRRVMCAPVTATVLVDVVKGRDGWMGVPVSYDEEELKRHRRFECDE